MDGQPPSKRRKLDLSEIPGLLEDHEKEYRDENPMKQLPPAKLNSRGTSKCCKNSSEADSDLHEELERVEETQIQASLPIYLDHMFGTYIGHSQMLTLVNTQMMAACEVTAAESSEVNFVSDTPFLDSQGFIRKSQNAIFTRNVYSNRRKENEASYGVNVTNNLTVIQCSIQSPSKSIDFEESECFMPNIAECARKLSPVYTTSPDSKSNKFSSSPVLFHSPLPSPPPKTKTEQEKEKAIINLFPMDQLKTDLKQCHTDNQNKSCLNIQGETSESIVSKEKVNEAQEEKKKRNLSHMRLNDGGAKSYVCPLNFTPLAKCTQIHASVSVFAMILQVNPVMEVACKTGYKAGSTVPMSSVLLGDPTKAYFKLSLWRQAAAWVERFTAGDIVVFRNIKLKTWLKEIVGTTVMRSSVINLHQPKKPLPNKINEDIPLIEKSLDGLMEWAKKYYGYLLGGLSSIVSKSQRIVNFVSSSDFGSESVIHFRAKVLAVISSRVLLVADEPGKGIHLHLLSSETSKWSTQLLNGGVGQVWEFMFLALCSEGGTQGGAYSLQTTSRSLMRPVKEDCEIASAILTKFSQEKSGCSFIAKDCSVGQLLSSKVSGLFELKAKALSIEFLFWEESSISLYSLVELEPMEMISRLCQAVYVGCESCSQPLRQDCSGIYQQCFSCMIKRPGGYPSSLHYFSPVLYVLQDSTDSAVKAIATHAALPKILGINATEIVRASIAHDIEKCLKVKEKLQKTLATSKDDHTEWIISCVFSKDDNSYVEDMSLSLLDWTCSMDK